MLWMITKDLMPTEGSPRIGKCGDDLASSLDATRVPADKMAEIAANCNYEFRLYDDDGNLYYEGVCKDLEDQDGDSAFEPLDWAECDVGAVRMDYRKKGMTKWQTL